MQRLVISLMVLFGLGLGQIVPYGFQVERGVKVLIFVAQDCRECEALRGLAGLPTTFIGQSPSMPYSPYLYDDTGLLMRAFYIRDRLPTVVILKDGHVMARLVKPGRLEEVKKAYESARLPETRSRFKNLRLRLGERVNGQFSNYTGMIVFWKQEYLWCEREAADIEAICKSGLIAVTVIAVTKKEWPMSCKGQHGTQEYQSWGIPGAPTHVFLQKGVVRWVDIGYRPDLKEVVEALIKRR